LTHLTPIPARFAQRILRRLHIPNFITDQTGQWLVGDTFDAFGEARAAWQEGRIAEFYNLIGADGTMVVLARREPLLALLAAGEMKPKQLAMWEVS
jgi:hypothetical protein